MIRLSKQQVLRLHRLIADATGGGTGVRDDALLDSALEEPFATFDGQDLYPSLLEKGARLGFTLITDHAFMDGNKRIGVLVMLTFLRINGVNVECTDEELSSLGYGIADGSIQFPAVCAWIKNHLHT